MDSGNRKKRRKSPDQTQHGGGKSKKAKNQQNQEQLQKKQKRHQEALVLSQELRSLSSQKRLQECLSLYRDSKNDDLRDVHHGSIVVDCCARCGDVRVAEKIVLEMLGSGSVASKNPKKTTNIKNYFWMEANQQQCRKVPIQAWTALLKGYVHSGMLHEADSLFCHLCINQVSNGKKRKRESVIESYRPNVRTLNTLLRGCLWTSTSPRESTLEQNLHKAKGEQTKKDQYQATMKHQHTLVGGVVTAERAWSLCVDCDKGDSSSSKLKPDSSSYEYYVTLLGQSLKCEDAQKRLEDMKRNFKVDPSYENTDPSILESVAVCSVAIARGYALLGNAEKGRKYTEEALRIIGKLLSSNYLSSQNQSSRTASSDAKNATGGKQAWKSKQKNGDANLAESGDRREESNQLFRTHRLKELRSEAASLKELCTNAAAFVTSDANYVASWMMSRLFYFSGGGTTGLEKAGDRKISVPPSEEDVEQTYFCWMHSLWHSFGLKETTRRLLSDNDNRNKDLNAIFPAKKRGIVHLPNVLSPQKCLQFRDHILGKDHHVIDNNGFIDFRKVFSSCTKDNSSSPRTQPSAPVHIEIGAGSGDWIALQAQLNPSENYVAVELRSDRVAQTFAKCLLHHDFNESASATTTLSSTVPTKARGPLENVCCVGSECGSFLRQRTPPGTIQTIFVNHPEPPTQTYDNASTTFSANAAGEEPAHMLNSQTLLAAARCLRPDGKGRLIIVTDNLIYARLVCRSMIRIIEEGRLVGISTREVGDLRKLETFGSGVHLYEGKPSISIGHYTPNGDFSGGTSYFDRLWRTGAGKHADMKKRFIIAVRTRSSADDNKSDATNKNGNSKNEKIQRNDKKRKTPGVHPNNEGGKCKKANKKRSAEKQQLRNERRLLKKQQQQRQQQQQQQKQQINMAHNGSK